MDVAPGTRVDRYAIEAVLGRGGMAVVYRARHLRLGSLHAIKVLNHPTPSISQRLLREGRAQSQLRHRNIVAVTDVIAVQGATGLVMEYIGGPSLDELLERGPLTLDQADVLGRGILAGVATAHAGGLVHRDLKPGNILLLVEDGQLVPKVADFGLAKILAGDDGVLSTRSGVPMGTPAYMAPEQTRDARSVDERADVFALGAILYELVAGCRAFDSDDIIALYSRIRAGDYVPVGEVVRDLPERMERAITGALLPDRDERIGSVEALAEAWSQGAPRAPEHPWPRALLASIVSEVPDELPSRDTASTFDPSVGASAPPSVAAPSTEPAPQRRSWLPWGVGAGVLAGVVALGLWALPQPNEPVFTASSVPAVSDDPVVQEQFEAGWRALADVRLAEAERRMSVVVEREPDQYLAWAILARAQWHGSKSGPAWESFWQAVERADDEPGLHAALLREAGRQHRLGAEEHLPLVLDLARDHLEDLLVVTQAADMVPPQRPELGLALLDEALQVSPRSVLLHYLRGNILLEEDRREDALAAATAGLELHPEHPALLFIRGDAHLRGGDFQAARASLLEAVERDAGHFRARRRLAQATLMTADDAATTALIERALSDAEPLNQRLTFCFGLGITFAGLGRLDEGEAMMRRGVELARAAGDHVSQTWLLGMMAVLRLDAGFVEEAAVITDELLSFVTMTPEIAEGQRAMISRNLTYGRGILLARRGDLDGARALLERMEQIDGIRAADIEYLRRELAIHDRDVAALSGLFEEVPSGCATEVLRAHAYERAGAPADARAILEALFAEPGACSAMDEGRWAEAMGRSRLAALCVADGDAAAAQRHLTRFHELWPAPDDDFAVVVLARQTEAALQ